MLYHLATGTHDYSFQIATLCLNKSDTLKKSVSVCHHLLTLMSFQTSMTLYSVEHEDIFKKNTFVVFVFVHTMKVNGAQSKYFFNWIYFCTPQKN